MRALVSPQLATAQTQKRFNLPGENFISVLFEMKTPHRHSLLHHVISHRAQITVGHVIGPPCIWPHKELSEATGPPRLIHIGQPRVDLQPGRRDKCSLSYTEHM